MNFRLKKDWYIEDFFDKVKIYDAGHIFRPDEDGKYTIENPINGGRTTLSFDQMLKSAEGGEEMFEPVDEKNLDLLIEEISESEEDEIKSWRIQLDVKTSKKNLKKIEKLIRENIQEFI